ncbi:MAG: M48 family metallopeptidase [Lentisphaeria bacterium]|jgi:predicted Zn-dependent protease
MRRLIRRFGASLLLGMALWASVGCQTAAEPYTGRRQLFLTSVAEENALGLKSWQEILAKEKVSADKRKVAALERVGRGIAQVAGRPDFQWEFKVLASPEANAFCLPGGKVAVYEGLFKAMRNDAELAAVVGHEVGHAIARHGGERMTQQMGVAVGAAVLEAALSARHMPAETQQKWLLAYAGVSTLGVVLPFSREQEYAADKIGVMLMAKAGYDPRAALDFWQRFSQGKSGTPLDHYLSTHPSDGKRIQHLRETVLPEAGPAYAAAPAKRGFGQSLP